MFSFLHKVELVDVRFMKSKDGRSVCVDSVTVSLNGHICWLYRVIAGNFNKNWKLTEPGSFTWFYLETSAALTSLG